MIGMIQGQCMHLDTHKCILMTGGIGYEIHIPTRHLSDISLNAQTTLHTHFVVREDAQLLFGFLTVAERDVFRILLKANQVGPKLACSIIDAYTPSDIMMMVQHERLDMIKRIKGIGPRMAEKLLVQLKGTIDDFPAQAASPGHSGKQDAIDALLTLGYKETLIRKILQDIPLGTTQEMIKAALGQLSSKETT